jgi:hypothetical protein
MPVAASGFSESHTQSRLDNLQCAAGYDGVAAHLRFFFHHNSRSVLGGCGRGSHTGAAGAYYDHVIRFLSFAPGISLKGTPPCCKAETSQPACLAASFTAVSTALLVNVAPETTSTPVEVYCLSSRTEYRTRACYMRRFCFRLDCNIGNRIL